MGAEDVAAYSPGPHDRITYDPLPGGGERLDEVVASGATVHVEAMSHHGYWIGLTLPGGAHMALWARDVNVTETEDWPVGVTTREPLLYRCNTNWITADDGVTHQCEVERDHRRHRCECGRTRKANA